MARIGESDGRGAEPELGAAGSADRLPQRRRVRHLLSRKPEQNNLSWLVEDHELAEEAAEDESPLVGHAFDLASADITVTLTVDEHIRAELRISPYEPPEDVVSHRPGC